MDKLKDIVSFSDIKILVDTFYGKVREDDLLAPIFNERIGQHWPEHMEKMYSFWQTLLLNERTYYGSPFAPHMQLPINHDHFERWLTLFCATIDALFEGRKASDAKTRAGKLAEIFQSKIEWYRNEKAASSGEVKEF